MLLHISAADHALGRYDQSMLSDQTIMELLVAPIVEDMGPKACETYFGPPGEHSDACSWTGVQCDTEKSVVVIDWKGAPWIKGSISIDILPKKLKKIYLSKEGGSTGLLKGTIETSLLPQTLETLSVYRNAFFGTLDLSALPEALQYLIGRSNRFCGEIDLTHLPKQMIALNLSQNKLSGTISLQRLPETLESLYLEKNLLRGPVSFENLPARLTGLHLQKNSFRVDRKNVPHHVFI